MGLEFQDVIPRTSAPSMVSDHQAKRLASVLLVLGWPAVLLLVFIAAWVSDDAYITLRTVDNFWQGFGLRWNVIERVQAYTHPLWLALLAAAYGITREPFYTTLAVSGLCTVGALLIATRRIAAGSAAAVALLAMVSTSRAFVDFSTSGLENPLTHLLIAAFFAVYWTALWPTASCTAVPARGARPETQLERRTFWLALLACGCALNRLDSILLVGPALLWVAWQRRSWRTILVIAAGFLPLVIWEAFALFYYGSLVPNTAYAKLGTGLGREQMLRQGIHYLLDVLMADPITALVIAAGVGVSLLYDRAAMPLGLGLCLSLVYTVLVGGDFMRGRFLTAAFFVSALIVSRVLRVQRQQQVLALAASVLVVGLLVPKSPWRFWRASAPEPASSSDFDTIDSNHGIVDEPEFYYMHTGLRPVLRGARPSDHPRVLPRNHEGAPEVSVEHVVGLSGYYGGAGVHIIDLLALADPLLARLPANPVWRVGHYERSMPEGYEETMRRCLAVAFPTGMVQPPARGCIGADAQTNQLADPEIAALYDKVALVTQAPLFDRERLRAIGVLNGWLRSE